MDGHEWLSGLAAREWNCEEGNCEERSRRATPRQPFLGSAVAIKAIVPQHIGKITLLRDF
jgi:hypothetical protein